MRTSKKMLFLSSLLIPSLLLTGCFGDGKEKENEKENENKIATKDTETNTDALSITFDAKAVKTMSGMLRSFNTSFSDEGYFYAATGKSPLKELDKHQKTLDKVLSDLQVSGELTLTEQTILADFNTFLANYRMLAELRDNTYRESKGRLLMKDKNLESQYLSKRIELVDDYIKLRGDLMKSYGITLLTEKKVPIEQAEYLTDQLYLVSGYATGDIVSRIKSLSDKDIYRASTKASKLLQEISTRTDKLNAAYAPLSERSEYISEELSNISYGNSETLRTQVNNQNYKAIQEEYDAILKRSQDNLANLLKKGNSTMDMETDTPTDESLMTSLYVVWLDIYYPNTLK